MRIAFAVTLLTLVACSSPHDLEISGKINSTDPVNIIRYVPDTNNQPRPFDTVAAVDGAFTFKVSVDKPQLNFIVVEGRNENFPFVAEKGQLNMQIDINNFAQSKTTGSLSNDDYMAYKSKTEEIASQLTQLATEINQARQLNDNLLVDDLQKQYTTAQQGIQLYEKEVVKNNPDSYLSALLLERMLNNKSMSPLQVKPLFESYSERIRTSKLGQLLQTKINAPISPTAIGSEAPNFTAPTPEGGSLELKQSLKKITILDFWASWCRPCRIENPNLVRTYNKLKDKGLHVVSVSLDRDKNRWIQAIKDDGLTWDHVSNLQYWRDPVAQLYKVSSIPATFILDENGVIIAKNLRGPQLEATLTQLIQQ